MNETIIISILSQCTQVASSVRPSSYANENYDFLRFFLFAENIIQ